MNELKDTVPPMLSEDYRERFKAEYWQLEIRRARLYEYIQRVEKGEQRPDPGNDMELLHIQLSAMIHYAHVLQTRALKEGIRLEGDE